MPQALERAKALDCVGDLYLSGCRIDARLTFIRPGHSINNALLRALFADESAYVISHSGKVETAYPLLPSVPAYA